MWCNACVEQTVIRVIIALLRDIRVKLFFSAEHIIKIEGRKIMRLKNVPKQALTKGNETPMKKKKELRNTNDKKRKSLLSAYSSYTKISKYQIPSKYRGRKK